MINRKVRIIFFGTPEFASKQLDNLILNGYDVVAAVTAPDKPAGRGKKNSVSALKTMATMHHIPVLQPEKLKEESFINTLESLQADLFIVIAFRMIPEKVWKMPPLGTINLHASLLPQYRGAAPINRAIINGEKETGITAFFINDQIDTGNIILQKKILITNDDTAGSLHDRMIVESKDLLFQTISKITSGDIKIVVQQGLISNEATLKVAPKIYKADCKINWLKQGQEIYNHIRGLSPYPTAYTEMISDTGKDLDLKIFESSFEACKVKEDIFTLLTDNKTSLKVALHDGYIHLLKVQQAGKKAMSSKEFLKGFHFEGFWKTIV
ncbi:MAG: methionyl-tRNA formyltransferase [Bacteroidetes bacterium HGW-Bacteroidetes-1]|jgi:methionyl-tRNA formyltransferase|nr:MAG: methionyl-tRNA formyltransferase [Bacteroidetes bacterium HGW-Bacteroidetes-1]